MLYIFDMLNILYNLHILDMRISFLYYIFIYFYYFCYLNI